MIASTGIISAVLRAAALAGALSTLPATPSLAASQSDEDACRPDVFRLCASAIPDTDAIVACLERSVPNLSPACRAVMTRTDTAPPVATRRSARSKGR